MVLLRGRVRVERGGECLVGVSMWEVRAVRAGQCSKVRQVGRIRVVWCRAQVKNSRESREVGRARGVACAAKSTGKRWLRVLCLRLR